jgi:transposase
MREKISFEIKQKAVTEIELGRLSQSEAARRLGINEKTIRRWMSKYRSEGITGLASSNKNRIYSAQTKQQAVETYLTGQYTQQRICEMFKIRSTRQLKDWLKVYNSGIDFKRMSGDSRMKSTHKATKEERIQVAKECLASGNNYGEVAKKYGVSYQQARTWTLKYKGLGESGLEDRRGKRKHEQEPRTELEKAQIRIAQLEHQLHMAEMENHLLKKLKEIERRETLGK